MPRTGFGRNLPKYVAMRKEQTNRDEHTDSVIYNNSHVLFALSHLVMKFESVH